MTDTPRTDAEEYPEGEGQSFHVVSADFARMLERELAKERSQFPSDRAYSIVEVFNQEGDPVIVSGIDGATNGDMAAQIERDLNERRDFMDKGDGRYLYRVVYESAQTDEQGRIELPGYWDLSLVAFDQAMKEGYE